MVDDDDYKFSLRDGANGYLAMSKDSRGTLSSVEMKNIKNIK
jgi:hypothetical protein